MQAVARAESLIAAGAESAARSFSGGVASVPHARSWGIWKNRSGLTVALLVVLPLLIYANTISARFGFRDDYSILREVNEEPGKVLKLCSSHARPLYGWMLESSSAGSDEIDELWAGGPRAPFHWRDRRAEAPTLHSSGSAGPPSRAGSWQPSWSTSPAAQVDVSWAICWPH